MTTFNPKKYLTWTASSSKGVAANTDGELHANTVPGSWGSQGANLRQFGPFAPASVPIKINGVQFNASVKTGTAGGDVDSSR